MSESQSVADPSGVPAIGAASKTGVAVSIVIAVRDPERAAPMRALYEEYEDQIEETGLQYEFIFAVEGEGSAVVDELRRLKKEGKPVRILVFKKWYGGSTVLNSAFEHASGAILVTLPAYRQIDSRALPSLFPALEENDMVVVERFPREDGLLTKIQVWGFHAVLRGLLGGDFKDLGCSVTAFKRTVLDTIDLYGDQHRFLPVLAEHYGFRVEKIEAPQTKEDTFQRHLSLTSYVNRGLDLVSIFFLTKFTRKPLRFFGGTGLVALLGGGGITSYLSVQRIFMGVPLRDKPMLLLGILLIVLGMLFFAIGLIGEMIIFTHSKELEVSPVEKIIE